MSVTALLVSPALPRALVVGIFGGAGLVLTMLYSRRGPMIYPVYAALLAALAVLLSRYPSVPFTGRLVASLAGFCVASAALYVGVVIHSRYGRLHLVGEGRRPEGASGVSIGGHAWRLGFLLAIGTLVSVGVAFIAA